MPQRQFILPMMDRNHDGEISAEEIKAVTDLITKLDKNGDGAISRDEQPQPPKPPKPPQGGQDDGDPPPDGAKRPQMHPLPPVFAAMDADHDGRISSEELAKAPDALKMLDKNGDGFLTPPELLHIGPAPHGPGRPPKDDGGEPPQNGPQGLPPGKPDE